MTDRNSLYAAVLKVNHAGGSGSCFYLKHHNLFVTNYHVIEGFHTVALQDNDRRAWRAHVVLANPARDIALLAAEGDFSTLPELTLATEEPLIGDKIRVAGYPFGMPFTLTEGSISSPDQLMDGSHYIQTDAAVNPGNSGGPMLNLRNEVIAITVSKLTDADNMGFGIPVDALRPMLERTGELDATTYRVQCPGCDEFIAGEEEYCPSCGVRLPEGVFRERGLTDLAQFCEKAIAAMGSTRAGPHRAGVVALSQGELRNPALRLRGLLPLLHLAHQHPAQARPRTGAHLPALGRRGPLQAGSRGEPDLHRLPGPPDRHLLG